MAHFSFLRAGGIVDDRGATRRTRNLGALGERSFVISGVSRGIPKPPAVLARERLLYLARRATMERPGYRRAIAALGVIAGASVLFMGVMIWWAGPPVVVSVVLTALLLVFPAMAVRQWRTQRGAHERAVRELAGLPFVCVACGYDIDALQSEEDGCIVCPECGGAWIRPGESSPRTPESRESEQPPGMGDTA